MMSKKSIAAALLAGLSSVGAWAITVTEYDGAGFTPLATGGYRLDGFGRGTSSNLAPRVPTAPSTSTTGLEAFFDTWNLDTTGLAPGQYSISSLVVDATGGLVFNSVSFSSYDTTGHRNTFLFDLNASGTQAVGSGTFTVLGSCPVASCVWIDVSGTQPTGTPSAGYGGSAIAAAVPEPATYALWTLGLAAVGAVTRRRRTDRSS